MSDKQKRHPGQFYLWFSQAYSMLRSQRQIYDQKDWEKLDLLELPVPCDGCTMCCKGPYEVSLLDHEAPRFRLKEKNDNGDWVIPRHVPDVGDGQLQCVYLGPDGCTTHENRPNVCKMFDCRTHMVCGVADSNNSEMVAQWSEEAWNNTDAIIIIGAMRTAANFASKNIFKGVSSVAPLVEYAFSHFPMWLGPVVEKLGRDTKKGDE